MTGNFESDYVEACKKVGLKPMNCLRFGIPLPPLPRKENTESVEGSLSSLSSDTHASGRKSDINLNAPHEDEMINLEDTENLQNLAISAIGKHNFPTRRILSDRRELSIQEFLKKAQIDPEAETLFPSNNWVKNKNSYQSRFKFSPTIDLENQDNEDDESDVLYKIELRNYKVQKKEEN